MKNFLLILVLYILKLVMKIIYFFIKIFTKQKNKITMLSRQSNNINLDFKLLKEELEKNFKQINCLDENIGSDDAKNKTINRNTNKDSKNEVEIKVLCKKIPKTFFGKIQYCLYMIKCMYHVATSKVCIIDGYNIAISALKHKKNTEIIQIWHAMGAIKKFGYQVLDKEEGNNSTVARIMKMHANYTCITCTSEETRKIYAEAFNTSIDKIKVLGMPRIDYLLGKNGEIDGNVENLCKEYPKLKEKKNIVYVPTFRKGKPIDISKIIKAIDKERYNLIIRLHPLDKTNIENEYIINRKYNTSDLIKVADYVITDYSAVAFGAATLNKPLFFYLYDLDEYGSARGLNIDLKEEMKNSTKTNIEEIIEIIDNGTYNYEELKKFKEKYVQTADIDNTKRIAKHIKETVMLY